MNLFWAYLSKMLAVIGLMAFAAPSYGASASVSLSNEVSGNSAAGRSLANTLDDSWSASFPSGSFRPDIFAGASGYSGSKTFMDSLSNNYQVDWQLGYVNDTGPGLPSATSFINATSGSLTIGTSNSIQSGAPNPFNNETRVSTGFSSSGLNGIKLDFSSSPTDVLDFGIFIGDLETRANNGTSSRVIIFNKLGALLTDAPINMTGTVLSPSGTVNYTAVEPFGSPSGPNNNSLNQWGNSTTFFMSINADEAIGSIIIHVGDDDHTTNNTGVQEQLGFAGFSLPSEPTTPPAPSLLMTKVANSPGPFKPGDMITYTYTVTNNGNVIIRDIAINDTHNGSDPAPTPINETLLTDNAMLGDSTDGSSDGTWDVLAPGDVITFVGTYTVTQTDAQTL